MSPSRPIFALAFVAAAALVPGHTFSQPPPRPDVGSTAPATATSTTVATGATTTKSASTAVSNATAAPTAAIRRLTESEYRHTIADVLDATIEINARFEMEKREEGLLAIGSGMLACGAPPPRSASTTGSATSDAMLTLGSTMRLTNELFAPFSSRRRTR